MGKGEKRDEEESGGRFERTIKLMLSSEFLCAQPVFGAKVLTFDSNYKDHVLTCSGESNPNIFLIFATLALA